MRLFSMALLFCFGATDVGAQKLSKAQLTEIELSRVMSMTNRLGVLDAILTKCEFTTDRPPSIRQVLSACVESGSLTELVDHYEAVKRSFMRRQLNCEAVKNGGEVPPLVRQVKDIAQSTRADCSAGRLFNRIKTAKPG